MKIVLLDEAQRRFEAEDRWWRDNRDAKELFLRYSLLVYVLIAGLFLTRAWSRFRIALAGVLAAVPTLAHVFLETPVDQYLTWAARPDINLLAVSSPAMGVIAVVITILLSLFALAVFVALVRSRGI